MRPFIQQMGFSLLVALALGAGCAKKGTDTITANDTAGTTSRTVRIDTMAFSPSSTTVAVGTTVTWTNNDSVPHTVTGDTGDGLNSSTLNNGDTYSFTFTAPGSFPYHCNIHPEIAGTVIVQ